MQNSRVSSLGLLLASVSVGCEATACLSDLPNAQSVRFAGPEQLQDGEWVRNDFAHLVSQRRSRPGHLKWRFKP